MPHLRFPSSVAVILSSIQPADCSGLAAGRVGPQAPDVGFALELLVGLRTLSNAVSSKLPPIPPMQTSWT